MALQIGVRCSYLCPLKESVEPVGFNGLEQSTQYYLAVGWFLFVQGLDTFGRFCFWTVPVERVGPVPLLGLAGLEKKQALGTCLPFLAFL